MFILKGTYNWMPNQFPSFKTHIWLIHFEVIFHSFRSLLSCLLPFLFSLFLLFFRRCCKVRVCFFQFPNTFAVNFHVLFEISLQAEKSAISFFYLIFSFKTYRHVFVQFRNGHANILPVCTDLCS